MHELFTVVAAAALSIGPPPAAALTNGPVSVRTCHSYTIPVFGAGSEFAAIPDMRWVEISFVNRHEVAAKKVRFSLSSGSETEIFVDSGTFSAGTTIVHGFSSGGTGAGAVHCAVDSVVFADGSSWTRQG